jgi:hypothetical protein
MNIYTWYHDSCILSVLHDLALPLSGEIFGRMREKNIFFQWNFSFPHHLMLNIKVIKSYFINYKISNTVLPPQNLPLSLKTLFFGAVWLTLFLSCEACLIVLIINLCVDYIFECGVRSSVTFFTRMMSVIYNIYFLYIPVLVCHWYCDVTALFFDVSSCITDSLLTQC